MRDNLSGSPTYADGSAVTLFRVILFGLAAMYDVTTGLPDALTVAKLAPTVQEQRARTIKNVRALNPGMTLTSARIFVDTLWPGESIPTRISAVQHLL